jgi:two-component system sensor histidine kinase/response regulator
MTASSSDPTPREETTPDTSSFDVSAILSAHIPEWVQIIDPSLRSVYRNESLKQHLAGLNIQSDSELSGVLLHPEDRDRAVATLKQVFETGLRVNAEYRYLQADGSYRSRLASTVPVPDASGRVAHVLATFVDIEDRVQAERARDSQQQFFAGLVAAAGDMVAVYDRNLSPLYLSESLRKRRRAAGVTDEMKGGALIHPDDMPQAGIEFQKVFNEGGPSSLTCRYLLEDGSWGIHEFHGRPILDQHGRVEYMLIVQFDVTERLENERKLRDIELAAASFNADKRLGALLQQGVIGVMETDPQGNILQVNPALCRMLGYSQEQLSGMNRVDLSFPEEQQASRDRLERFVNNEPPLHPRRRRARRADGSECWMYGQAQLLHDKNGLPERLVSFLVDVTEQALAERALAESEARYRLLAENQTDTIQLLDLDGRSLYDSPSIIKQLGADYRKHHHVLSPETSRLHPDDLELLTKRFNEVKATGEERRGEYRWVLPTGQVLWLEGIARAVKGPDGKINSVLAVARDITERKLAEQALAESEENYRLLADNQTDYVHLWGADGSRLYDSPSFVRLLGDRYSPIRSFSQAGTTLIHPEDRAFARRVFDEVVADGKQRRIEFRWVLPSGELRWVEVTTHGIFGSNGVVDKVLGVSRDITERKQVELQRETAFEQARMASEAKSQFLAKVSHELRTPLNAVLGYGYLLGKTRLDAKQSAQLQHILRSSQHLLGLISDVLDLSRIEAGEQRFTPAQFSLAALIESALAAVRPAADGRAIALRYDNAPQLPDAWIGDARLIEQVLLNYLSNAVKYTEHGSITVRVRVQAGTPGDRELLLRMEVQDTGSGIAPDKLDGLFKAFSQVMPDKRGTGLGLEISRRLVELMGGEVGVQSRLGEGSCFWLAVPLQRVQQQATNGSAPASSDTSEGDTLVQLRARHRGKTILVADDDLINQTLMEDLLEEAGLIAQIADDGAQALEMARAAHYPVVLMDLQMPNMDGMEATRAIRQLAGWQQVPIVAWTADVFTETREACLAAGMTMFLGKPVEPDQLYPLLLQYLDKG